MEIVYEIAYNILVIGGAICMILLFFLLIVLLRTAIRFSNFVADVSYKFDLLQTYILMPFRKLSSYLSDDDEKSC